MPELPGYPLGVTCARAEHDELKAHALDLAAELGAAYYPRQRRSFAELIGEEGLASLIVVNYEGISWHDAEGGSFFWHPNTSILRLRSGVAAHLADPLVRASGIEPGDRVLDATLGMGADAIILSVTVGSAGRVVGVEESPIVACLVRHGLATYDSPYSPALRRIQVVCGDHRALLTDPDFVGDGFAAIFFDPMFDDPIASSEGIRGLRRLACYDSLSRETIALAQTLVTKAVVVKRQAEDGVLDDMGADRVLWRGRSRVGYAVFGPRSRSEA